jgi:hypothetical protein
LKLAVLTGAAADEAGVRGASDRESPEPRCPECAERHFKFVSQDRGQMVRRLVQKKKFGRVGDEEGQR